MENRPARPLQGLCCLILEGNELDENTKLEVQFSVPLTWQKRFSSISKASFTALLAEKDEKCALQVAAVPGDFYTAITLD